MSGESENSKSAPVTSTPESSDGVSRRDFIGNTLIGAGAALLTQAAPGVLREAEAAKAPKPVGMTGLTAEWTGPGGIGDFSQANGNTHVIVNRAHGLVRNQEMEARIGATKPNGEEFDLIVVGAGIAGLTAAYSYRKAKPDAKILLLEMQDMAGGEARQNEFEVDGYHLWAKQGSTACGSILPDGSFMPWHPFYFELGLPTEFTYQQPEGLTKDILFPTDDWLPMFPNYKGADIGYYFDNHGWVKNPWSNNFEGAPISEGLRRDLMRMAAYWRAPFRPDWRDYLDTMSYQDWWTKVVGVSEEAVWFAEGPMRGALTGLGPDAISAKEVADPYYLHHESLRMRTPPNPFGLTSAPSGRAVELPGGNSTIARRLVQRLIPEAYPNAESFDAFVHAKLQRDALDQPAHNVKLRLNSTAISIKHVGDPKTAKRVEVVYADAQGKLVKLYGKGVVAAGQQHSNKKIIQDLPAQHREAMEEFAHAPILTVNVAVRHWRFLQNIGISHARWFDGFGWFTGVHPSYLVNGKELVPFNPNKPIVLTMFIPFLKYKGLPPAEQARVARHELFGMSYADIEGGVREQFTKMFGPHGFNAATDIAGITANRWGHAYVVTKPGFFHGKNGGPAPSNVLRQGHGRIAFAHTELMGTQLWIFAVIEGMRAAQALAAQA